MHPLRRWLIVLGVVTITSAMLGCGDEAKPSPTDSSSPTNTPFSGPDAGSPAASPVHADGSRGVSLDMDGPTSGEPGDLLTYRLNYEVDGDITQTTVELEFTSSGISYFSSEVVDGDPSIRIIPGGVLADLPAGTGSIDLTLLISSDVDPGSSFTIGFHELDPAGASSNPVVITVESQS